LRAACSSAPWAKTCRSDWLCAPGRAGERPASVVEIATLPFGQSTSSIRDGRRLPPLARASKKKGRPERTAFQSDPAVGTAQRPEPLR
jgi:hypothetical protein